VLLPPVKSIRVNIERAKMQLTSYIPLSSEEFKILISFGILVKQLDGTQKTIIQALPFSHWISEKEGWSMVNMIAERDQI
jgi:hypothetical protein